MKPRAKKTVSSVTLALLGLGFTVVMLFIGGAFMGAGHGSAFFATLVFGQFGTGLGIWPALGLLIPHLRNRVVLFLAIVLALTPILSGIYTFSQLGEELSYVRRVWRSMPLLVLIFFSAFIMPTILTLRMCIRELLSQKKPPFDKRIKRRFS